MEGASGGPVADFCAGLRRLQERSDLTRGVLARRLGYSRSQLYAILDGTISRPPDWTRFVEPFVRACTGNDEGAVELWRHRHGVLVEVHAALRRHVRRDDTAVRPPSPRPACPYRGLSAFGIDDAAVFFGREALTDRLAAELDSKPLVAVVGPSGSGKSSLVLAGAAARLRAAGWAVATVRPAVGTTPVDALAAALRPLLEPAAPASPPPAVEDVEAELSRDGLGAVARRVVRSRSAPRLLIVVDQFEELFARTPAVVGPFVDLLRRGVAGGVLTVVLTLRVDFLGSALEHPDLSEAIQDSTVVVGRMNRAQLRQVIEAPLPGAVRYEPGLVERILDDVSEQPGHLALLEFALTALWERQEDATLTHHAYDGLGGVAGALANYAEEVYRSAAESSEPDTARLFVQLVHMTPGHLPTRRVARRTELPAELWDVAQRLATSRLVVTGRDDAGVETVELAHEALISEWRRLRTWLDADRDFRVWQERLRTALDHYRVSGRDSGALLRGVPLAEAQRWSSDRAADVSAAERAYIDASRAFHHRGVRRLQALVAGLVVLLVVASGLGIGVERQRRGLERQERLATSQALAAHADATINTRPVESILLSLQAFNEADTLEARASLLRHAAAHSYTRALLTGHTDRVAGVAFSPDGSTLATGGVDTSVRLWDVTGRRQIAVLNGHGDRVQGVAFGPDGRVVASAGDDRTIRLWDTATRREIGVLTGHTDRVRAVAISPDGRTVASAAVDGDVRLWDMAGRHLIARLVGHDGWVRGLAFSPDGASLATAGVDRTLRLWRVSDGSQAAILTGHGDRVRAVAFSPDGATMATAGDDRTVRLWEVRTGREVAALTGHTDAVTNVGFSPDGRMIVSGGQDNTVRLWDVVHRRLVRTHSGHTDWVSGVAFSPDGHTFATASHDHTVRVWDVATSRAQTTLAGHANLVTGVAFRPDGAVLATSGEDGSARVWDVRSHRGVASLLGHTAGVTAVAVSPDGRLAGTTGADRTVRLWDLGTGREVASLVGHTDLVRGAAFSPDGTILATSGYDHTVRLWDVAARRELAVLNGHSDRVSTVAFSRDGRILATGSADRTVRLWDVAARRELAGLTGHSGWVSAVAFSPDGRHLVTGAQDATVRIWEVAGRRTRATLTGHTGWVWAVAISPDGRTVASGADDRTIRLWDVATRRDLAILTDHTGWILGLAFSPDGRTLASASEDGTARLWDLDRASWQRRLCELAGRNLTRTEWAEFLPDRPYRRTCPGQP